MKIKRVIELEEKDFEQICEVANDTKLRLGIVPLASSIILQSKPYDDNGDLISREALKDEVRKHAEYYADRTEEDRYNVGYTECACEILDFIDNAQPVPLPNEQIAWEQGYECGYHQAKEDAIRRIAEQYSEHNELIPKWLSIGDMKGGTE